MLALTLIASLIAVASTAAVPTDNPVTTRIVPVPFPTLEVASSYTVTLYTEPGFRGKEYSVNLKERQCVSGKDIDYQLSPHFWSVIGPKDAACTY